MKRESNGRKRPPAPGDAPAPGDITKDDFLAALKKASRKLPAKKRKAA